LALASKTVLIIGIESFTGKYLASYFRQEGFNVKGTSYGASLNNTIYNCDITNKQSIKSVIESIQPEYIINLAGVSFVGHQAKASFYNVNIIAVENILESIMEIKEYSPRKILLVSSATVYGNQDSNLLDESMQPSPLSHYGISKFGMECIVRTYFDKLNIIITRPFNYTGVGQESHFLIPKIVKHFQEKQQTIELGNTEVFREFNDVSYVCEIYKKLIESDIKSEIVNVSSNRVISLHEVIDNMQKIAGYTIQIKRNPLLVRENEIVSLSGSVEKLFSLIGYVSQKEFQETLINMYKGTSL